MQGPSSLKDYKNQYKNDPERKELYGTLAMMGSVGVTICGAVVGGFFLGMWASAKWELGVWPIFAGVGAGVAFSFFWAYRKLTAHLEKSVKSAKDQPKNRQD